MELKSAEILELRDRNTSLLSKHENEMMRLNNQLAMFERKVETLEYEAVQTADGAAHLRTQYSEMETNCEEFQDTIDSLNDEIKKTKQEISVWIDFEIYKKTQI